MTLAGWKVAGPGRAPRHGRLPPWHCRQSRLGSGSGAAPLGSRIRRRCVRQPGTRRLRRRHLHLRFLREAGSSARARRARERSGDRDGQLTRWRGGASGSRRGRAHQRGHRRRVVLGSSDRCDRAGAVVLHGRGPSVRRWRSPRQQGRFEVDAVSPMDAARRIGVPVLLIHGALDHETPPEHSQRIFDSLRGRKRLLLVQGAGHNQSLQPASVWSEIEGWIDSVLGSERLKVSRRQFLYAAGAAAAAGTGFYTWRVEPHWLEIVRRPAARARAARRARGPHAGTDQRCSRGSARRRRLRVECVRARRGSRARHRRADGRSRQPSRSQMFEQMEAVYRHFPHGRIATVGIPGNHDYGPAWSHPEIADRVVDIAQQSGIVMLRNQVHEVEGLQIVGLDDLWAKRFDAGAGARGLRRSTGGDRAQPQSGHGRSSRSGSDTKAGSSRATRTAGSARRRFCRRRCCRFATGATRRASSA